MTHCGNLTSEQHMLESLTGRQHNDFLTFNPDNHLCCRTGRNCTDYGATHNPTTTKEKTKQALTLPDYCISFNFIHPLEVSAVCYTLLCNLRETFDCVNLMFPISFFIPKKFTL